MLWKEGFWECQGGATDMWNEMAGGIRKLAKVTLGESRV